MTGQLYLYLLCVGILTALTPWAIVGAIVLLGSQAGSRGAVAFTAGWFCAVVFVCGLVAAGLGGVSDSSQETTSTATFVVEILLGLAIGAFAYRKRMRDRALSAPAAEPGWLDKLGHIRPIVAFAFGTFMINVVFVVDAGVRIASSNLATTDAVMAVLFYSLLATGGLVAVLFVFFKDRAGSEAKLTSMRAWMALNNSNVVVGMLAAIGLALALKGVGGLLA